jgi:hypothetical protein
VKRSIILTLLAVLTGAGNVRAQVADSGRANRMLTRLTTKLRTDRTLPDSLRRLTPTDLTSPSNSNHAALLDDSTSSLLLRTMATTVHALPVSLCGSFLGGAAVPTRDLDAILPYADSVTLEQWSTILERIVRARAAPVRRPVASDSMMKVMFLRVYAGMNPTDQMHLIRIAQRPPPTPADACWSMQVMLDQLAALPATDAGPFVRGMFGQMGNRKPT